MALKIDNQGKKALTLVGLIVIIATLLFLVGCSYLNQQLDLPNDNPAEEAIEEVLDGLILQETGIDPEIDLTPEADE